MEWPFCRRDYDRFGIKTWQENGFEVEVWDFTKFLHKEFHGKVDVPDPVDFKGYRSFSNFTEAVKAILKLDQSCFIMCLIFYKAVNYPIYRAISRKNLKYGVFVASYPASTAVLSCACGMKGFIKKIFSKIRGLDIAKIREYIFANTPHGMLGIKAPDFIFGGAEKTYLSSYPVGRNTEIIKMHYLDYDIYLEEIKKDAAVDNSIGVFLDEYLPFHPDWAFCQVSSPVRADDYYPKLCGFFEKLEKSTGTKIVIAAHPRSNYEKHPEYFGNRKVFRARTAGLVRQAGFVILHTSYSVNFAVLFNKPAIFITTDGLNRTFLKNTIDIMSEALGKKAINLDEDINIDFKKELSIDEERYRQFRNNYIKKEGTPEKPYWQAASDRIKKLV